VNEPLLQSLHPEQVEVEICRSEELERRRGLTSELDEMWSYVRSKANPRWLWHAIAKLAKIPVTHMDSLAGFIRHVQALIFKVLRQSDGSNEVSTGVNKILTRFAPLIITRGRSWPMCWAGDKMTSS
jgi:IS1 transposase